MMNKMGRTALILLVILAMIATMAACSQGQSTSQPTATVKTSTTASSTASTGTTAPPDENLYAEKVSFTTYTANDATPQEGNRTVAWLEEKFNVDITWEATPWGDYANALATKLAGGDIPDEFQIQAGSRPSSFDEYIADNIIMDVTQYLDKCPNLARYLNDEHSEIYVLFGEKDGTLYGIPEFFGYQRHSILYRKDWFDQAGVSMPDTWDDFKTALKTVVQADPEGTHPYGISVFSIAFLENSIPAFTGSASSWYQKDGEWIYRAFDPGFKDYVAYWESLYDEGLLDPEWNLLKTDDVVSKFASGKIAVSMNHINTVNWNLFYDPLMDANSNADMELMLPYPAGPAGRYWVRNDGYFTIDCFSAQADSATMDRIMAIFDWNHTEEGRMVSTYGLEDIHYTMNGEEVVRNLDETNKDSFTPGGGQFPMYLGALWQYRDAIEIPQIRENGDALAQYGLSDSIRIDIPLDQKDDWSDLNTRFSEVNNEWYIKFFIGEKSVDTDWDGYLQALRDAGYEQMQQYWSQCGYQLDLE